MNIKKAVRINRNRDGKIKSILLDDSRKLDEVEKLSVDSGYYIYVVPDDRKCIFNDDGWLIGVENNNFADIWEVYNGWSMRYECLVNGFPFPIKLEKIWASDIKVTEMNIYDLEWNLDYPWWLSEDGRRYGLKPRDFLREPDKYKFHWERTKRAEISYPLTLVQTKQDRLLIYDGVHRYVKQKLDNRTKVKVKTHTIAQVGAYIYAKDRKRFDEWMKIRNDNFTVNYDRR